MTPKQVRSFLSIVETGSVQHAAKQLHLAPSSISAHIKELSSHLGVPLFKPNGRNIVLTQAGKALLPSLQSYQQLIRDIEQQAQNTKQDTHGELKLFAPSSMCIYRLPSLIDALHTQAPEIEIVLTHEPFDYEHALQNYDIDAAILVSQQQPKEWQFQVLHDEPVIYVCHPKRQQHKTLSLQALQQQALITTESVCSYRLCAEAHFKSQGLTLKPKQSFSNVEVIKRCVLANMGIGLLPLCVVEEELKQGTLVQQAVEGTPYLFQSMLVYTATNSDNSKLQALMKAINYPNN